MIRSKAKFLKNYKSGHAYLFIAKLVGLLIGIRDRWVWLILQNTCISQRFINCLLQPWLRISKHVLSDKNYTYWTMSEASTIWKNHKIVLELRMYCFYKSFYAQCLMRDTLCSKKWKEEHILHLLNYAYTVFTHVTIPIY